MKTIFLLLALLSLSKMTSQGYFIPQYKNTAAEKTETERELTSTVSAFSINSFELEKSLQGTFPGFTFSEYETMSQGRKDSLTSLPDAKAFVNQNSILEEIKSKKDIQGLLDYLKANQTRIDATLSDEQYKEVNDYKSVLKSSYTQENFLSKNKRPKKFKIWDAKLYDNETINKYFSGQKGIAAFSSLAVQTYSNATYLNTELISFYFSYVRLGVSGSLKATNNSEDDAAAIQQDLTTIFQNSGSLNLNFSLPLIFYRSRTEHIHYGLFAETSVGITPNLESTDKAYFSDDLLVNNQAGLNFKFDVSSSEKDEKKQARFFFELPVNYIYGNKKSYQLLDFNDNTSLKLNVGAVLGDLISFRVSGPLFSTSDRIMKVPYLFSINISPNNIAKK